MLDFHSLVFTLWLTHYNRLRKWRSKGGGTRPRAQALGAHQHTFTVT